MAEALALADLLGFDKDKLFQILNVSYGRSGIYQRNYGPRDMAAQYLYVKALQG